MRLAGNPASPEARLERSTWWQRSPQTVPGWHPSENLAHGAWRHRDGGVARISVTAAAAVDPTDGDLARALRTPRWSPPQRLWAAVLYEVLVDLRKYARDTAQARAARAWLEDDRQDWPLAFRPVCDVLGLDPDAVRFHLRRRRTTGA